MGVTRHGSIPENPIFCLILSGNHEVELSLTKKGQIPMSSDFQRFGNRPSPSWYFEDSVERGGGVRASKNCKTDKELMMPTALTFFEAS